MAALQRAIIMMGKFNLVGIPRDILLDLRGLQDIYTERIDLDEVSDDDDGESDAELDIDKVTSRQIEPHKGQQILERQVTPRISNSQNSIGGLEDDQNAAFKDPSEINHRDKSDIPQFAIQKCRSFSPSAHSETQPTLLWRWGPCATSRDAMRFFRAVI